MHGPQGASRSAGALPCCIGSHYAVRTAALRHIGGIGPELDEDYSTSMIMTAHGWRGVFAIDAIASGDGPVTFEDAMRQECVGGAGVGVADGRGVTAEETRQERCYTRPQ